MRKSALFAVAMVATLCAAGFMHAAASRLVNPGRHPLQISQQCMDAGLALQTDCTAELNAALTVLGGAGATNTQDLAALTAIANDAITHGKVDAALESFNPGPKCCAAACKFGANLCGCDEGLTAIITSILEADTATYQKMTSAFADKCKFPNINKAEGNCPPATPPPTLPVFQCPA